MRVNRSKNNYKIKDVVCDLSTRTSEPSFVYFTKEQLEQMLPYFTKEEQLLRKFLFETMARFPKELLNLKVKHVYERDGEVWLVIPRNIAKACTTFDRDMNLIYCGEALKEHIKEKCLGPEDYLFDFSPEYFNIKSKKVAVQVFGDVVSHPVAKGKFSEISGYDYRHSGTIHFRILSHKNPAFISLDTIRQRGGWADFDKLNYYSRFIGLNGKIDKAGLLIQDDRHKIEKELEKLKEKDEVRDKVDLIREEMDMVQQRFLIIATDNKLTTESKNQELMRLMQILAELKNQIHGLKNKSSNYNDRFAIYTEDKESNRTLHASPFAVRHQGGMP